MQNKFKLFTIQTVVKITKINMRVNNMAIRKCRVNNPISYVILFLCDK